MKIDTSLNNYILNGIGFSNIATNSMTSEVKIESKEDEALKEQTDAFESFLIKTILDISINQENSLFGKDASDEIYSSMYNDTMSRALSGGMGFSNMLFNFLKERG
ncbi:hypothetical protein FMM58_04050 [Campylobacter sp. LR291e]|nr:MULTISPECIES: rod-binding protein [unclassified Campylobacter]KAA6227150.1 hypothetical protein FMM54_03150 [Campylobacter sp. LR185c]KAA6227453.1 hypothetical protein FMM55_02630 [Campylobacter sp. LR196d]KAA6228480.1 hypothetical protein FMM57_02635 [Campylobacter sp. LR286c]KAA6230870.1 hypothetical protein FMM58_04050 [Campylobacter sp. LR291e]KAA6233505.1 hypothetical protein FMM56_03055 [Campylobacter sp. LR264d]